MSTRGGHPTRVKAGHGIKMVLGGFYEHYLAMIFLPLDTHSQWY